MRSPLRHGLLVLATVALIGGSSLTGAVPAQAAIKQTTEFTNNYAKTTGNARKGCVELNAQVGNTQTYRAAAAACFQPGGEIFYVKDPWKDGRRVAASWVYSKPGGGITRIGTIINDAGSDAGWGIVDKSFPEDGTLSLRAGYCKVTRYRTCRTGSDFTWGMYERIRT